MSAGGITYHLRARRYRKRQWRSFCAQVKTWLNDWRPQTSRLVVFGSSAGYTLDANFLQSFDEVTIVEPDPIARFLFKRRFSHVKTRSENNFSLLKNLRPDEWRAFSQAHPDTAFLFSNVIGQMIHIRSAEARTLEDRVRRIFEIMHELKVPWASYHDVFSTSVPPQTLMPFTLEPGSSLETLVDQKLRGAKKVAVDHGTLEATLGLAEKIQCAWWEIEPLRYHLIAWIALH